jgi:hypothetical protein
MLTVSGTNTSPAFPTVTSTIAPLGDGTPFTAGWPFWSKMRMGGALFVWGVLMRLSLDSARTKNTIANIITSQKVSRTTAFNRFMILFFLLRASVSRIFFQFQTEPRLTLCVSVPGILRRSFGEGQAESLFEKPPNLLTFIKER